MEEKVKVAVYTRVSTSKDDQLNSLENQRKYFTDFIGQRQHWELCSIYADRGISGTKLKRPKFDELIYDAGIDIRKQEYAGQVKYNYFLSNREPKFNLILLKNTSRFARNVLGIEILRILRKKGVYVFFLDLNKSTKDVADDFLITILSIIDEQESKTKSERVRIGHEQSAKDGIINSNTRLFGYQLIKGLRPKDNKLVAIPEEAKVVRTIFELYAQGHGIRTVSKLLTEKGMFTRQNKEFQRSTIKNILKNEKYYGCNVRNKYYTGVVLFNQHSPKLRPESEWIYHDDANIEPIISKELFEKCQQVMKSHINHKNSKGIYHGKTKYAGVLRCGKCGASYSRNSDRGRYFYNCSNKKKYGVEVCDNKNISEDKLEELIQKFIDGERFNTESFNLTFNTILAFEIEMIRDGKLNQEHDIIVVESEKELEEVRDKLDKLVDLYINGEIDKDIYNKKKLDLDKEEKRLVDKIDEYSKDNKEYQRQIDELQDAIDKINAIDYSKLKTIDDVIGNAHMFILDKEITIAHNKIKDYGKLRKKIVEKYNLNSSDGQSRLKE